MVVMAHTFNMDTRGGRKVIHVGHHKKTALAIADSAAKANIGNPNTGAVVVVAESSCGFIIDFQVVVTPPWTGFNPEAPPMPVGPRPLDWEAVAFFTRKVV